MTCLDASAGAGVADLDPANTAPSIVDGAVQLLETQRQLAGHNSSLDQKMAPLLQVSQQLLSSYLSTTVGRCI